MTTEAALVFDAPRVYEELDQLAQEGAFLGVTLRLSPPDGIDYVFTDEDHIHIASRYRMTSVDVGGLLVLMNYSDEEEGTVRRSNFRQRKRSFDRAWTQFVTRNQVRNQEAVCLESIIIDYMEFLAREARDLHRRESQDRARQESVQNHFQNRRRFQNMTTRGMERSAQRRRETEVQIREVYWVEWDRNDVWTSPGPDGTPVTWNISDMVDMHLWNTIIWCVRSVIQLFHQYNPNARITTTEGLASKQWLAGQTAFRAIIQEAVRRRMTFPRDVYQYIREYVLRQNSLDMEIQPAVPWADPEASYQADELASFLDEPAELPRPLDAQREFGKELRDIDLD